MASTFQRKARGAALVAVLGCLPAAGAEVPVDAVHDLLVAEFATQRGELATALAIYDKLAREYRDPTVARRAVEAAIRGRDFAGALDASALLLELDPESPLAREMLGSLLANEGGLDKAQATVARLLGKATDKNAFLMQLSHLFAKFPDKQATLAATKALAAGFEERAEGPYAVGVALLLAGQGEAALKAAGDALERRPGWEPAAILYAQALRKTDPRSVVRFYEGFVESYPQAREVRLQLGRELAAEKRLAQAREQFRIAGKQSDDEGHAAYAIGLLSLQLEDYTDALESFKLALERKFRDTGAVYLSLGAAAEGLKRFDEAIGYYRRVESADWMRAQLKIATLIAKQQGLAAGREYLQGIQARSPEDQIQRIQVEAQLLRDAKAWKETFEMLDGAVKDNPDSYELIYDRAMAAERLDKLDVAEADLRRVIRMKPDYAHAYNALGYTLAEKTDRLAEAKVLIEQAIKLAPDDPFIQDSLGWVNYRLGNHDEALRLLQNAYSARPDPEIAAHLGEVLWKVGQKDEARKVWRTALTENPEHESLLAVMQKFKP